MSSLRFVSLLPCHGLDDFPRTLADDAANQVLAAWTLPWHPALLAAAGAPDWEAAAAPAAPIAGKRYLLPDASEDLVPPGWVDQATQAGAEIIRLANLEAALAACVEAAGAEAASSSVDPDDFFAMAFAYLHMELLARRMRYMSNIDQSRIEHRAVAAAKAACEGDPEKAREQLQGCYDALSEARDMFYCVGGYLVDFTLTSDAALGADLLAELADDRPRNLLISGASVERLAERHPASLDRLRELVRREKVCLVGGDFAEIESPLAPAETLLWQLLRGRRAYREHLGDACKVFGRRRFGLTPFLPQVLYKLGYGSAYHVTLDDGRFPLAHQCHSRWEGIDGTAVDALFRVPQDAALDGTLLCLADNLGTAMDFDHVATVGFAHWPGRVSRWYRLLQRVPDFQAVFGEFIGLQSYVQRAEIPGYLAAFAPDDYEAPYLVQDVEEGRADPISRFIDHRRGRALLDASSTLLAMAAIIAPRSDAAEVADRVAENVEELELSFAEQRPANGGQELMKSAESTLQSAAGVLAHALGVAPDPAGQAKLAVNPWGGECGAIPAWGIHVADSAAEETRWEAGEELLLRGRALDVVVHPETGGLQAVRSRRKRGNRMSQQLALRGKRFAEGYSRMVADYVGGGTLDGRPAVESVGRLLDDDDQTVAAFRQRVGFAPAPGVVVLEIEVDPKIELGSDPWRSYLACRFSWGDATVDWRRSVAGVAVDTTAERIEAPDFLQLVSDVHSDAILCGGAPYHVRVNSRMVDSILLVRGEQRRTFRLGVCIDSAAPHAEAQAFCLEAPATAPIAVGTTLSSGWLLHVDRPGAATTGWELLREEGRCVGFRVRLLDTLGLHGPVRLEAARPFTQARLVDFLGATIGDARIDEGAICFDLGRYEWTCVEARWD